jgi:hypothetical protein
MKEFIWVDVGKLSLYIHHSKTSTDVKIKNNLNEIMRYFNQFENSTEITVVLEPTWIYFQKLVKILNDLNIYYFLIPLDVIHNLNKILWESNKNDTIDARKIANYGELIKEHEEKWSYKIRTVNKIPNEVMMAKTIYSQIFSIEKVLSRIKQLKNNTENFAFEKELWYIREWYEYQIEIMENMIKNLYKELEIIVEKLWYTERMEKLKTCPGVGEKVGMSLIVFFMELEHKWLKRWDQKQVRKYSWLSPNQRQSWETLNKTKISKRWNKFVRYNISFGAMNWKAHLNYEKRAETTIWKFGLRMKEKFENWNKKGWLSTNCAIASKLITTLRVMFCDNKDYERR